MSRLLPEVDFRYQRANGMTVIVVAVGIVIPGLRGARDFPAEAAQVENLQLSVFSRSGEEIPPSDLPEIATIRELAEEELVAASEECA